MTFSLILVGENSEGVFADETKWTNETERPDEMELPDENVQRGEPSPQSAWGSVIFRQRASGSPA